MVDSIDVLVIGAGVVGLAVAREFAALGREVLIVEKADAIGTGTSSRNSEVIHAGIYYSPGSLKAQFCVEGKTLLYDYCKANGVEARQIGKLIVAQNEEELFKLTAIHERAEKCGVYDLKTLNAAQAKEIEPALRCVGALLSPSTGIVDSYQLMLSLQAQAESLGAIVALRSSVVAGKSTAEGIEVSLQDADGGNTSLLCRTVINCAGHGAHDVALALTRATVSDLPPRYLAKGSYCSVSGASPFKRLIYPVPVPGALGTHVTLDLQGRVKLGPNIEWIKHEDYTLSDGIIQEFRMACEGFWPGIRDREISMAYCGIRPKISGPTEISADFYIKSAEFAGMPKLVNLFGIESPGLTASLSIAQYVSKILNH